MSKLDALEPETLNLAQLDIYLTACRYREALRLAQRVVETEPRLFPARRQLIEALIGVRDMPRLHDELSNVRREFSRTRFDKVLMRCVGRLVEQHRYQDVMDVIDRHLPDFDARVEALVRVVPLATQGRNRIDFAQKLDAIPDTHVAAVLRTHLALESFNLKRAEQFFAYVPEDRPYYRPALFRMFKVSEKMHDPARIVEFGSRLIRDGVNDDGLGILYQSFRAAASLNRMLVASKLFASLETLMRAIREDDERFRLKWKTLARYSGELYDVEQSEADLARARAMGLLNEQDLINADVAGAFLNAHRAEVAWARDAIRTLLARRTLLMPQDELVRILSINPKILNVAKTHQASSMLCWLAVVDETLRQTKEAGGKACLLPDWLNPALAKLPRAPMTLSYHTVGSAPGVMHFKEADLPNYVSIDS